MMIKHYPYKNLGSANHGWLKSKHHFSFAHYYNPSRMGFGKLRVVNDDWVAPNTGFPSHSHRNMEIVSFIRSGDITHHDSTGNKGITKSGEVQVMTAGTGITHSEYNRTTEPLTFYQIWIEPNKQNLTPRWQSKKFPRQEKTALSLLVSGYEADKGDALFINQQARIYGGKLVQGSYFEHNITNQAYILASTGTFSIENTRESKTESIIMNQGDGCEITQLKSIWIKATKACEIIIIDTPK
jgi:hypothetical protein